MIDNFDYVDNHLIVFDWLNDDEFIILKSSRICDDETKIIIDSEQHFNKYSISPYVEYDIAIYNQQSMKEMYYDGIRKQGIPESRKK